MRLGWNSTSTGLGAAKHPCVILRDGSSENPLVVESVNMRLRFQREVGCSFLGELTDEAVVEE